MTPKKILGDVKPNTTFVQVVTIMGLVTIERVRDVFTNRPVDDRYEAVFLPRFGGLITFRRHDGDAFRSAEEAASHVEEVFRKFLDPIYEEFAKEIIGKARKSLL